MGTSPYLACPCSCSILSDDFDRTQLGCSWNVMSGNWVLDDDELHETTGDGIVLADAVHPADDPTSVVFARFEDIQGGNDYMVLIDCIDDENYLYGRYSWDGGDKAIVSVGEVTGGTLTVWDSLEITPYSEGDPPVFREGLTVCRSENGIYAQPSSDYPAAWKCNIEDNGGRKAGLRSVAKGGASPLKFGEFWWKEHRQTRADCYACACDCEDRCVPKQMQMTFIAPDTCATCSLHLISAVSAPIENATDKQYTFNFTNLPYGIPTGSCSTGSLYSFMLLCPLNEPNRCDQWQLDMSGSVWHTYIDHASTPCGWTSENGVTVALPCECSCDPLILKYGPFLINTEYGPCSYEIHIAPIY